MNFDGYEANQMERLIYQMLQTVDQKTLREMEVGQDRALKQLINASPTAQMIYVQLIGYHFAGDFSDNIRHVLEELKELPEITRPICADIFAQDIQYSVFFLDFTCFVVVIDNPQSLEIMGEYLFDLCDAIQSQKPNLVFQAELFNRENAITVLFTEDERLEAIREELGSSQGGDDE